MTRVLLTKQNGLSITVDASKILETAHLLKNLKFDHVISVTATDYPEENRIDVIYHVSSFEDLELAKTILEIRTTVSRQEPNIHTLVAVWPSIEFLERETTDLMGINFGGREAMARLLLPEDFEGEPPLRKSYTIRTEGIDA